MSKVRLTASPGSKPGTIKINARNVDADTESVAKVEDRDGARSELRKLYGRGAGTDLRTGRARPKKP